MAGMAPLSSHSACNSCLSDPPLTHYQNAPCQAVYGPGVEAAQVNTFLTRAFGIRHTQTHAGIPLALHSKRCLQHGTVDSARSSRAHQSPPTSRRSKCTMTSVAPALNGVYMHMPTETPRVHDLTFDHSHTRPKACRAPFGCGGRLGKQNAVPRANHLGQTHELLAQEREHIGGCRQADILTR